MKKYFIIYPNNHQFAIQCSDGRFIQYFDNTTYDFVLSQLKRINFYQGLQTSLNFVD